MFLASKHALIFIPTFFNYRFQLDAFVTAVGQYDWSTLVKLQLLYNFIVSALYGMGTERHFGDIQRLLKKEVTSSSVYFFLR